MSMANGTKRPPAEHANPGAALSQGGTRTHSVLIVDDEYGVSLKSADVTTIKTVGDIIELVVSKA